MNLVLYCSTMSAGLIYIYMTDFLWLSAEFSVAKWDSVLVVFGLDFRNCIFNSIENYHFDIPFMIINCQTTVYFFDTDKKYEIATFNNILKFKWLKN